MTKSIKKLKHFIATHTFNSPKARKEFSTVFKERKKNADWFGEETLETKEKFFQTLKRRNIIDEPFGEDFNAKDYALLFQLFFGKGDFFFCHWLAIDEQAIIDRLSAAGSDQFFITMATPIDAPKVRVNEMMSYIQKLK